MVATYLQAREQHNAVKPHATGAVWQGDRLTLWSKTQWVGNERDEIARRFGFPPANVRMINPFVGGAFGSPLRTWPHVTLAAMAVPRVGRPRAAGVDPAPTFQCRRLSTLDAAARRTRRGPRRPAHRHDPRGHRPDFHLQGVCGVQACSRFHHLRLLKPAHTVWPGPDERQHALSEAWSGLGDPADRPGNSDESAEALKLDVFNCAFVMKSNVTRRRIYPRRPKRCARATVRGRSVSANTAAHSDKVSCGMEPNLSGSTRQPRSTTLPAIRHLRSPRCLQTGPRWCATPRPTWGRAPTTPWRRR